MVPVPATRFSAPWLPVCALLVHPPRKRTDADAAQRSVRKRRITASFLTPESCDRHYARRKRFEPAVSWGRAIIREVYVLFLHGLQAGMDDRRAFVLDVVHPGSLGDRPRLRGDEAELEPEGFRAGRGRLLGDGGAELGSAKHIHEVDRLLDVSQGVGHWDAEDLGAVGPHGD